MIPRSITLPEEKSFFLFGPRQTGKSTLIENIYSHSIWIVNLLFSDVYLRYIQKPSLFRWEAIEKIENNGIRIIFVDEIQRVPSLLNEVHYLMETYRNCQFILTGSSARKLKRGGVNLLAGRAVERRLFPFIYEEIREVFKLEEVLIYGSLPPLVGLNNDEKRDILTTYVHTYLEEEIKSEGIARNLGGFSRFLEMAGSQCGELINYSTIARECALPARTVQAYYQILEDTLIGFCLLPWRKSIRKRLTAHPKFYFFDIGVTNAINKRLTAGLEPVLKGRLFEQFIVLETYRKIHYARSEAFLYFWRTNHGAEVDLLIEKHGKIVAACEIKSSSVIQSAHLSGLRAFKQEHPDTPCYVISLAPNPYIVCQVKILPWKDYLVMLNEWL